MGTDSAWNARGEGPRFPRWPEGAYNRPVTLPKDLLPADPGGVTPFRLADWTVYPALHRLGRGSQTVQVEPRVMHLLVCLAARPGRVVARDVLLETIWGETIVVEKALTNIVSDLRAALGDDPVAPRYVETIRKGGYRLVARVRPLAVGAADAEPGALPAAPPAAPPAPRRRRILLVAPVLLAGAIVIWLAARHPVEPPPYLVAGRPFATDPGIEMHPVISPDGGRVAYAWPGPGGTHFDIYVKSVDTESTLRLTQDPADEFYPAWSPDGRRIAFVRVEQPVGVYIVPAGGGAAELLTQAPSEILGLSWSPDGASIAYSAASAAGELLQIQRISLDTREIRQVNVTCPDYNCAIEPAFSPDGRQIAFTWADIAGLHDLYVVPAGGGEARRLTRIYTRVFGFDWSRDGRFLFLATEPHAGRAFCRLSVADGALERLPTLSPRVWYPSLARRADRMVYEERLGGAQIWEILLEEDGCMGEARPLVASTRLDAGGSVSPDGDRIAFFSRRRGEREIWTCDRRGDDARPLVPLGDALCSYPLWSPDGRQIAFSAVRDRHATIHIVDVETGATRILSRGEHHELPTGWSREAPWLYFMLDGGAGWQVWRMRPSGQAAELVDGDSDGMLHLTRDGRSIYALGRHDTGIWEVSLSDARPRTLRCPADTMTGWRQYACVDDGLYFTRSNSRGGEVLGYHDFATGSSDSLGEVPRGAFHMTVAPDGRAILLSAPVGTSDDIILVDGFTAGLR